MILDCNFGEIEMCIGLPINYTMKIKSKIVELYSLSKIDFAGLSVVFNDYMETFLDKSLLIYKDFMINYHRIIEEYKEMNKKVKNKLRKKPYYKKLSKSSKNLLNFKFRESILEKGEKINFTPLNHVGIYQQDKFTITVSPPKNIDNELFTEKSGTNKLKKVSSVYEREQSMKKSLSTKSIIHLQSPYMIEGQSQKKKSTKSLNHIILNNENQKEITKTLTRTSIQFIHDLKKEINQVSILLDQNKRNFSPRSQSVLNNKLTELKNENCITIQLDLINQIEEIIKNKKNESSIC